MSSFVVHRNKSASSGNYPFVIDVQSDLLSNLDTRMVVPLASVTVWGKNVIRNLNPIVQIEATEFVVLTQHMASVPKSILGETVSGAEVSRTEILGAIDFLVTGI